MHHAFISHLEKKSEILAALTLGALKSLRSENLHENRKRKIFLLEKKKAKKAKSGGKKEVCKCRPRSVAELSHYGCVLDAATT